MLHPQYLYYAAIVLMATIELVRRAQGREAFGRALWVILAVACASFAAYQYADWMGWRPSSPDSMFMPGFQIGLHGFGFCVGLLISRHLPGHFASAVFLPMATVDLFRLYDAIWAVTWWKALYLLALAQLLSLAVGADLHPLGRRIRAWASRTWQNAEMRISALWGAQWT